MDSGHKRIWQGAFLLGIAACILAAILAYGFSTLAAVISGGTLVLGILSGVYGLLNRKQPGGADSTSLPEKLANALEASKFLKIATCVIWIIALGLGAFGARKTYNEYVQRSLDAKKITIEGLVLSASNDPADNAVVTLLLSKRQEVVTAPGGKFTFSKVDLSDEPSKTVRIRASWRTHEAEITADLTNGASRGLTIKLPPGDPPFRVTYFLLEGYAIDFLLHNKLNAKWEEKLGGQPYIVPNDVLNALSSLIKTFSQDSEQGYLAVENTSSKKSFTVTSSKSEPEKFFTGSEGGSGLYISNPGELIRSMEDERQPWHVFHNKREKRVGIESLVFRRLLNPDVLNRSEESLLKKFYQHITKDYMPPDLGYVSVYFLPVNTCEGEDAPKIRYVGTNFQGRSLGLRVAVLENISKDPISLDSFAVKVNRQERLRTPPDDKATLDSQPFEKQDLFPKKLLSPGEKIVIPLELPLTFRNDQVPEDLDAVPVSQNVRAKLTSELGKIQQIEFPEFEREAPYRVSARTVERILSRPAEDFGLNKEYFYGPSMIIDGIEISKVSYPFRRFDSAKIIIRGGTQEGSCPYVYTYSTEDRSWLSEGVILFGINGKHKEATEEKELTRFDGRVLIKEQDPEESFIDSVYVKAINLDGSEITLHPKNKRLRFADHNYSRLRQGEEITIDFDLPRNSQATKYILGMVGYYVPHKKASLSRARPFAGNRSAPFARKRPSLRAYQVSP